MPDGLPDSAIPVKQDNSTPEGLPASAKPISQASLLLPPQTSGNPILPEESKPPTGLFDIGMDIGQGILGLPSVHKNQEANRYYDIGQLIQTGAGIGAGVKLGSKIAGKIPTALEDLSSLKTPISEAVKDAPDIVEDVKLLHPDLGAGNAPPPSEINPVQKLNEALKKAKPLRAKQEAIYTAEKGKRIAEAEAVTTRGYQGHVEKMRKLSGEYEQVPGEKLGLSPNDTDNLVNIAEDHPELRPFEKRRTVVALTKVLNGQVPQENELALLSKVYGPNTAALAKEKRVGLLKGTDTFARKSLTTWDFSAPGRQGLPLIHTKEFWSSLDDQFKAWGSEKGFQAVQDSVRQSPTYDVGQEVGLRLYDLGGSMGPRAERLGEKMLEQMPGVRRSERAYTAFLNKLRQDHFNALMADARTEAIQAGDLTLDPYKNLDRAKKIAEFVNTASGSGSLGKFERSAEFFNSAFFAPRLQASRIKMLSNPINPNFWLNEDPFIKKQYLKSLAAWAGAGLTTGQLARIGGATVSSEPNSTDFGKIKIGNTRMDPFAGGQQYVVAMAKLLSNEATSPQKPNSNANPRSYGLNEPLPWGKKHTYGDPTGLDTVFNFALYKTSPLVSFAAAMLRGKDFDNQPFDIQRAILNRTVPIIIQDLYSTYQDDPKLLPIVIPASAVGVNTQTYGQ